MSKDEVVRMLIDNGHKAKLVDGVVIVNDKAKNYNKISKFLKGIGYNSSFGIRYETEGECID